VGRKSRTRKGHEGQSFTLATWKKINRVWAEMGAVRIQLKDGRIINLSVKDAAHRALQLNRMSVPDFYRKTVENLIEIIISSCREALHQKETKEDPRTVRLSNLLAGKTADGKNLAEVYSEEALAKAASLRFWTLTVDEIVALNRNKDLDNSHKQLLMEKMHRQRLPTAILPEPVVAV
jgi:hypothetical protein